MKYEINLLKYEFDQNGFVAIEDFISSVEVNEYLSLYDDFLTGKINTGANRSDLGAGLGNSVRVENITQIMWPSDFVPDILNKSYHAKALGLAKELLGEDAEMDFDMLIDKAPMTNTITPWHQDAAYWLDMPDKRAVSIWLALDDATPDNGCMWYIPGSHKLPLRSHRFAGKEGGALMCDGDESEGTAVPLTSGSCVLHQGATLHYSRGNQTTFHRRAWILNFRPKSMIDYERAKGFDHGRNGNADDRKVRS